MVVILIDFGLIAQALLMDIERFKDKSDKVNRKSLNIFR